MTTNHWKPQNCVHTHGLTTPNAAPIEIHVNCLNSMGRFHPFSTISTYSVAYHDKTWSVLFQKQVRYMFGSQTDFELQSMTLWTSEQLKISSKLARNFVNLSYRPDAHPFTHCTPARLSWNSYIWYPAWRKQSVFIKYSQNYSLFIIFFNSTEVRTEALKIFRVVISLFRVVRPYIGFQGLWGYWHCPFQVRPKTRPLRPSWFYEFQPIVLLFS